MTDFYQEEMIAEFKEPQNRGKIPDFNFEQKGVNASCGDDLVVFLKLSDDGLKIENVGWDGQGCVVSVTSMSVLSEKLKGKTLEEVLGWDENNLLPFFGMEELNKAREKCFMLGLITVQKTIKNI